MLFPKTIAQALGLPVLLFLFPFLLSAQLTCDACLVALPDTLPADTIFLEEALTARVGERYSEAVSFRVPRTTTPVAANDPNVPAGITISSFTVKNVANLPPGLSWQVSQTRFELPGETDGCIRFCGTPLQAGLYDVEVVVTARVLVVDQTASFTFPLLVEPAESVTEGFTVVNDVGCGAVEAGFVNNVPSLGRPGFSYRWDFGNGNMSLEENPGGQLYAAPGTYEVSYEAIIDTTGYFLTNVRVEAVGCSDPFNNAPDLQLKVFAPDGTEVYSSGVLRDVRPPVDFNLNLEVAEGNYVIGVYDDDDGLFGGDKTCGTFDFNRLSAGTLTDSEARITVQMLHPVDTVRSRDTVTVFAQPAPPVLILETAGPLCAGDTVFLAASYSEGVQWYRDSLLLPGAGGNKLPVGETGHYMASYTSPDGCQAVSEPYGLEFASPPPTPVLSFDRNLVYLADSLQLPDTYRLEWYLEGEQLESDGGAAFCTSASGAYELWLTDEVSGCRTTAGLDVIYDPAYADCTSATDAFDRLVTSVGLFPNPTDGPLHLRMEVAEPATVAIRLFNAQGQLLRAEQTERISGRREWIMDLSDLPAGLYLLRVRADDGGERGFRLIVQ